MRTRQFFVFTLTLAIPALASLGHAAAQKPFLVVIDPGHGGSDFGTVFKGGHGAAALAEKSVTLALALKTAEQLRARGIKVQLTRTTDTEIAVPARTALANRLHADLFISIHMNSPQHENRARAAQLAQSTQGPHGPNGVETYILNHTTDASARRLVQLENAVLSGSEDPITLTQAHSEVALILKDLRLDANLTESKRLACLVHQNLVVQTQAKDRGVKQGLFYVLLGADMPSILVEAGFLTHPKDRARVLSADGQLRIAASLADSVEGFRQGFNPAQRLAAAGGRGVQTRRALSSCIVH